MDLMNRRATRSSFNENDAVGKRIPAGKDAAAAGTRRALVDQKNTQNSRGLGKSIVSTNNTKKPIAVPQKKISVAAPKARAPDVIYHPNIVGMDREWICAEFVDDAYKYLMSMEKRMKRPEGFLADALPVTPKMRSILVDWLLQVHQRFHLLAETLHLTVFLVDCVLSTTKVEKTELQLVGVACMLVASKYEEMYAPDLTDYEFITDNTFSKKQILRMEMKVLSTVNFDLSRPHSILFLRWLNTELSITQKQHSYAKYFSELSLMEYSVAHLLPSRIAGASLVIAGALTREHVNEKKLCSLLQLSPVELKTTVTALSRCALRQPAQTKLNALKVKYQSAKNMAVSNMSSDDLAILESLTNDAN